MSADNPTYEKLRDALIDDRHRALKAHGEGSWDVADVMAIVWPEIEKMLHHYEVTLRRLAGNLDDLGRDAKAQIIG